MSIYSSLWSMQLQDDDDQWHEVYAQAVMGHIKDVGPKWEWLPPPVDDDAIRAVFICWRPVVLVRSRRILTGEMPGTRKGTERNGQEYTGALLVLTGAEYNGKKFYAFIDEISCALQRAVEEIYK